MDRAIIDFEQDDVGEWVAVLACGHRQHVRHRPPWQERVWVLTADGRQERIGTPLGCRVCDEEADGGPGLLGATGLPDLRGSRRAWARLRRRAAGLIGIAQRNWSACWTCPSLLVKSTSLYP